jgi:putative peptidoglycan lipid II flippase
MKVKRQDNMKFSMKSQNTILSAAAVIFVSSGLSAILGIFKNRLLASYFGVSDQLAIFYTADRIPNLVFSVLIVGAISTIFIPVFMSELKKSRDKAFGTASTVICATFLFFLVAGSGVYIFSQDIIRLLGVGKFTQGQVVLGSNIMRLMLISQFVLVGGSLVSSLLQAYKYFLVPAIAPILYNAGMIIGIVFLSKTYGIYGPAYGTIIGAVLHLLIQIPAIKHTGFTPFLKLDWHDKGFAQLLELAPPRVLSVLITSALATINNSFALLISEASVVYLKFGTQLMSFPVTLFGASIAAACLPTLSAEDGSDGYVQFKKTFLTSLHQMNFLVLPASAILLILRIPVVRIVFGVSNFPWSATVSTGLILGIFTFSIFPQSAVYLISRAFYAVKDTLTPVKVSVVTAVINIALSLIFIGVFHWGVWAVALSFVITSFLDMVFMLRLLGKKIGGFDFWELMKPFLKMSLASTAMAITLYVPIKLLDQVIFDTTRTINLLILTGIAGLCGGITYLVFTKALKIQEVQLFYQLLRKLKLTKAEVSPSIEQPTVS